ncbi:MAG: hypothetical protein JNL88_09055 [Bacteroidia bacterium]|nr:hypothetical protein [Bacteroidia bacterium]
MSWMKDLAPDLICVAGFSKKIPPGILQIPVMGVLNIHSGPLPAFRGAHPFYYLVKDSRAPGGVTIHWMNEKLDDGNIIQFIPVKLLQGMNLATYNELCAYHAAMVLPDLLTEMESGNRPAGTSNNGANAMNCRNPGLTLLDETIPVEVALWLFNAYSDVLIFEAVLKSGNMKITKLSKSEFQDSTPLHLKDGVVYIQ